jgi:hypothetical protein
MIDNNFLGTWKLISWYFKHENGEVNYPFGEDAIGYLIYTANSYMSVHIMSANRPMYVDSNSPTPEEILAIADTCLTYCGKYEILADKIIHYPEVSTEPTMVGVAQERFFEIRDNTILLSTPPFEMNGVQTTSHLVWQRV